MLENLIWEEIKNLLNNNYNLKKEYQRRLDELTKEPDELERNKLNTEEQKLQNSVARLIDSYTEGFIDKIEFEPRIKKMKLRLTYIKQQIGQLIDKDQLQIEIQSLIACIGICC